MTVSVLAEIVVCDKVTCRGYVGVSYLKFPLTKAECCARNLIADSHYDSQDMGSRKRRRLQFLSARFLMSRLRYINDNVAATLHFLRRLNVCKKIFQRI